MFAYKEKLMKWTEEKKADNIRTFLESLPKGEKGTVFEFYLAELYRGNGWLATRKGGRGDGGADILIYDPRTPTEVAFIIQAKNQKQPLAFEHTVSELNKFETKAKVFYDCNQYRLVSINGFVKDAIELREYKLSLKTWEHVEGLIEKFDPDGKSKPEIELYPHNEIAYENVLKGWEENDKVAVVQATGTGKSFIILKVISDFIDKNKIVLAPSNIILDEIKKNALWLESSTEFMTYAKLMNLSKDKIEKLKPSLIVLDEFHRVGAELWGMGVSKLLESYPEAKVLGTTATPVRYLDRHRDMTDELFDKNVAIELSLPKAIVKGILPNPKYISALHTLDEEIEVMNEKIAKSKNPEKEKKEMLDKIKAFNVGWEKSHGIPEILNRHIQNKESKFIVFCKDKEHLEEMESWVEIWFKKANFGKRIKRYRVISGEYSSKEELKEFQNAKKEKHIHLLFSIDMLNEGLHVDDIDGVILLRPTESPIVFYQQIGRSISTGNKKQPLIFDFVNNFNQIKSVDFINDLEKEKKEENKKRRKLGLRENNIEFTIFDETKEAVKLFQKINEALKETWESKYEELVDYYEMYGNALVPVYYESNPELGRWVGTQRTNYNKGLLPKERIHLLDAIDFVWSPKEHQWNLMYEKFKKYVEENGNPTPSKVDNNTKDIALWVKRQRKQYNNNKLEKEKIDLLDKLGFEWIPTYGNWDLMFEELKNYKKDFGNCLVSSNDVKYKNLGGWVSRQRERFNNNDLSRQEINKLNEIGFDWNPTETSWNNYFEMLKIYKNDNGHCNVPTDYIQNKDLGKWVSHQRGLYIENKLKKERLDKLNSLGFVWDYKSDAWDNMYEELKTYKEVHGDCMVPQKYQENTKLGTWVGEQRKFFKRGKLSYERIEKLDELEFIWDVLEYNWQNMYNELIRYKETYGDCLVPDNFNENKNLVIWVSRQRSSYTEKSISQERIDLLNEVGFVWKVKENYWNKMYSELIKFKNEHGHLTVSKEKYKDLYTWVVSQKQRYKKGNLPQNEINRLNEIGFFRNKTEEYWNKMYLELVKFKNEHGHLVVPSNDSKHKDLYVWTLSQRQRYKRGTISKEQMEKMEEVDFNWTPYSKK